MKRPFAALFDWDGVIVDSSRAHETSWELLAEEERRVLPSDHFKKGFGMKNERIIPDLLGWTNDIGEVRRLSLRKEELYRQVVQERGLAPLPGVKELLLELNAAGWPCVIGSSTHRLNIEKGIETAGLQGFFSGTITAEDVAHGKPDPEVFLKAASLAKSPPQRCVVFEDALVGIEAARRGGMKVVAVATTNPAELLTHADHVVERLTAIRVKELEALWADDP